jgi:hypothetical protein
VNGRGRKEEIQYYDCKTWKGITCTETYMEENTKIDVGEYVVGVTCWLFW